MLLNLVTVLMAAILLGGGNPLAYLGFSNNSFLLRKKPDEMDAREPKFAVAC